MMIKRNRCLWTVMTLAAAASLFVAGVAQAQMPGAAGPSSSEPDAKPAAGDEASPVAVTSSGAGVRYLSEFGPLGTGDQVKAAYAKAKQAMATSGGVLLVPAGAGALYSEENTTQISPRTPAPPAETKSWRKAGPGITVIQINADGTTIRPPSVQGVTIDRTLRMPLTESLPHWTTDYALNISNRIIHGSNSYLDFLAEPTKAGPDARFYVRTIRGLRVGAFINVLGRGTTRACIKSLGYDPVKNLAYFVADCSVDQPAGTTVQNKSNEGVIWMSQVGNADNQTYDIMLNRWQYALGDTYMYFARYRYMSNIHSSGGDENGNIFACYTESISNNFTATVDAVDWKESTLKFKGGDAKNVETLGNSRAVINLNPSKAITKGKVIIVPAESYWDTIDTGKYTFEGKTYPTTVTKGLGLRMGGLIRGDKDCPWDQSIVGRWFGVTEKSELISHSDAKIRWYQVDSLTVNPDGTKDITIQRFWWGAKPMQSPTLYREENGTWDGHIRPLTYVIAPGTYATDVGRAVPGKGAKTENIIGLAPYKDMNTPSDFAPGDAVEQCVGPDPFKPTPIRIWMWDHLPSAFPAPAIDLANETRGGGTSRYAAMWIRGGVTKIEDLPKQADGRAGWENGLVFDSVADVGFNFKADFTNAALLFQQPNHEQPIRWYYGTREPGKPFTSATLVVTKETGDLKFDGGDARFSGSVVAKGLSGDEKPARNLRGKGLPVKAGATSVEVVFPNLEADGDYAVFIEQTWLGNRAVTAQTEKGFTVTFDKAAPENAKLHWMIVR
ncbi:MAG: hypothetical protein NTW19_12660 [Planctomycetota bacterium]|nr:hypothetical protein [Planctomycetota bacterium]